MLPARNARNCWLIVLLALFGCTTGATEVIVRVDTDAPANRALVLTATVHAAAIANGPGETRTWTRAYDAGAGVDAGMRGDAGARINFPATFAIVPGSDQPRNEDVVLVLDAVFAPVRVGEPPVQFRRVARFPFVPEHTTTLNIFLALGCGNAATGCTSVPDSRCTVSVRCEEMGETCGDEARCVTPVSQPTEGDAASDGSSMDVTGDLACPASCPNAPNGRGVCVAGICTVRCDPNFADCDDNPSNGCETNITASTTNCGTCGHACPVGQFCATGSCIANCSSTQHVCGGACVDLSTDTLNCGACNVACPIPANGIATCTAGMCGTRCNPMYGDCNHLAADGCETNLSTSTNNCGFCGNVCTSGGMSTPMCIAGSCGLTCAAGRADCNHLASDGCEVNITNSPTNCGSCGTICPVLPHATPDCTNSMCGFTCDAGFADCDGNPANGCETDTSMDPAHCGSCSNACPNVPNASPICNGGACGIACHAGFANCDGNPANGCEVDVQTSLANCGTCGAACMPANATPTCSAGTCGYSSCNSGYFDVDGNAMNGCECAADSNPGTCGSAMSLGSLAVGSMTTASGNIVPAGNEDWFQVSFVAGGHPQIAITTNPGGDLLQIQDGACGTSYMCMDGSGDSVTDWEFFDTTGTHTTRNVTAPTTILFRVFGTASVTCANYTVTVSN